MVSKYLCLCCISPAVAAVLLAVSLSLGCGFIGYDAIRTPVEEPVLSGDNDEVDVDEVPPLPSTSDELAEAAALTRSRCETNDTDYFCDAFEDASFFSLGTVHLAEGNSLTITPDGHIGSALRAQADDGGNAMMRIPLPGIIDEEDIHVRFWFWRSEDTHPTNWVEVFNLAVSESGFKVGSFDIIGENNMALYLRNPAGAVTYSRTDTGGATGSILQIPAETWICIESALHMDPEDGFMDLRFDGEEVLRASRAGLSYADGPINSLQIGMGTANRGFAYDVKFDEFVISNQPIGCASPN